MNVIYSYILLPILVLLLHVAALFSKKLQGPVFKRDKILSDISTLKKILDANKQTIIIHTASMGEFEHIKPIIEKLTAFKTHIIVTFFSPSGYDNVKSFSGVDYFLYMPYDFKWIWKKLYLGTRTSILLISKHDVWPNQVHAASKLNVNTVLLNASLNSKSSRKSGLARLVLSPGYKKLDKIFAISDEDKNNLEEAFECKNCQVVGDTKFDQVLSRKQAAQNHDLLNVQWIKNNKVLVLGSLWPQDAENILVQIDTLLKTHSALKIIIVPHQPTKEIIGKIAAHFKTHSVKLFSEELNSSDRVLIVDRIGILADMYKHADFAYVGGSFKQGIHNVLEPAIYNVPVLYGPFHTNSFEALQLFKAGGSQVVTNPGEFNTIISRLLTDAEFAQNMGEKAAKYAFQNTGSTQKILDYIKGVLA